MKRHIVSLRVSGRALAAAVIEEETLAFHDVRYLPSEPLGAVRATQRFMQQVLGPLQPVMVVIDGPVKDGSRASQVLATAQAFVAEIKAQAEMASLSDLLSSYGIPALRSRTELRAAVAPFWAELGRVASKGRPYVVDAAALALYADVKQALGVPPPA